MTSDRHIIHSCYLFVDRNEHPILAARYMIDNQGIGHFIYGESYISRPDAFAFDPLNLPITFPPKEFISIKNRGEFGVLSDATPDNWGRRLILALHRTTPANEVEWLIASHGSGVGCLIASGSKTPPRYNKTIATLDDLADFFSLTRRFDAGEPIPHALERLVEFGSSMGGARPKLLVSHDGKEWIAKINRDDDKFDISRIEYTTLKMAKAAGVHTVNARFVEIGGKSLVLVERFDRNLPEKKAHYISAHSLLNFKKINEMHLQGEYSYMGIASIAMKISTEPKKDCAEIYRRMVFNALIGNTDDHAKNHGFLMTDYKRKLYRLAPAFDLLPHLSPLLLHSLGLGKYGREASKENLLSCPEKFYLTQKEALSIYDEVEGVVSDWKTYYQQEGVTARDITIVQGCFSLVQTK